VTKREETLTEFSGRSRSVGDGLFRMKKRDGLVRRRMDDGMESRGRRVGG
jgi:hypothetical protein